MKLEIMRQYWMEAYERTTDLQPDQPFSTPQLVTYLNTHLPPTYEKFTKTKVNYLRLQNILNPVGSGDGEIRTSWRYTPDDVRCALVVEFLKTRDRLSIQACKGWLRSFEDAEHSRVLSSREPGSASQEIPIPTAPTPVSLTYALFRNRILATLITALSDGKIEVTPPECLIALRVLDCMPVNSQHSKQTWDEVHPLLEDEPWYLAASDTYLKLYLYADIKQLQKNRPEVAHLLPHYRWYCVMLQDTDLCYEVILGLPEQQAHHPSIVALDHSLAQSIENGSPIKLSSYPGLATLLRAAFVNHPGKKEQTRLSILAEIIATASGAWDYCNILVPEPAHSGEERWLYVQEQSSKFPLQHKGKRVEIGKSLSGWCYRYHQSVVVEPTSEYDPRIAFFEEEGRPTAAAAVPAITEEQRVVGVIYVARSQRTEEKRRVFSEELLASLKAFGYICGDMIARDQIEIETVRGMTRLSTLPLAPYTTLEDLLLRVVDVVQRGVNPEKAAHSWIYLLTLNIQTVSQDAITQWLCQQGTAVTDHFLANRLWDLPHSNPLPTAQCMIGSDQYVFAILQAVDLPETIYKQRITRLQEDLSQMRIGRLSPDFYLSAITLRYKELRQLLANQGTGGLMEALVEHTRERLIAGPYLKRGHEALHKSDLDHAVSEFEDALRYAPNSWYGFKQLAEARMLQGTPQAIEEAIEKCQKALKLNPDYASAHCLLADCLSYRGRFGEALIEYEKALALDSTRHDFLARYGLALAAMTPAEYWQALEHLRQLEPALAQQRTYLEQPWLEAIDKFDRVRKLRTMYTDNSEDLRNYRVDYHYQRGYTHLQAGLINKAVEDFAVGRKLAPDNLALAQAYSYALSLQRKGKRGNSPAEIELQELKAGEA